MQYDHHITLRTLIGLASFIVIVAGIKAAEQLLIPFLLSIFITTIAAYPLYWLQNKRIPSFLAYLIVLTVIITAIILFTGLLSATIAKFSADLPTYQNKITHELDFINSYLAHVGIELSKGFFVDIFNPGKVMAMFASVLSGFGNVLTNAFLIILTVIFMLSETANLPSKIKLIGTNSHKNLDLFKQAINKVRVYMAMKTAISFATGLFIYIALVIIGVDYALLWGVCAFLLNFIPNIGSIIAAVPAVLLALIQLGIPEALMTAACFMAVNIIMGNVVEPRIMGKGLGLSTLVVFLSLVFWGWILGPVGMFLSVPLTITAHILLANNPQTRWLAILLSDKTETESTTEV